MLSYKQINEPHPVDTHLHSAGCKSAHSDGYWDIEYWNSITALS